MPFLRSFVSSPALRLRPLRIVVHLFSKVYIEISDGYEFFFGNGTSIFERGYVEQSATVGFKSFVTIDSLLLRC